MFFSPCSIHFAQDQIYAASVVSLVKFVKFSMQLFYHLHVKVHEGSFLGGGGGA